MNFNTSIVIFNHGAFGGAARRIINLFFYLYKIHPQKFFLFVNPHLYNQIKLIYADKDLKNIILIDDSLHDVNFKADSKPIYYKDTIPDPVELDKQTSFLRKFFWFVKNKNRQRKIFKIIEKERVKYDISVLNGIAAGALPLVFYNKRNVPVIFSFMDSWFTDVHIDMKKFWYRKYYSYNDILENADIVDVLSPYIAEGLIQRGININNPGLHIAPCSFVDHSICRPAKKERMEIAFSSRLEPDKNPMLFLEAAEIILQKYPEIYFHILGEGSLVNEVQQFISSKGLSGKINFMFHKNPPDILSETSIFVSLQSATNYPSQSVLEAMSCGNAIIASNRGDTHLFINESNGILIDIRVDEIVKAIEILITNTEHCHQLGENARKYSLKEHNIEKYSEYYLKLLHKAISSK